MSVAYRTVTTIKYNPDTARKMADVAYGKARPTKQDEPAKEDKTDILPFGRTRMDVLMGRTLLDISAPERGSDSDRPYSAQAR